MQRSHLFIIVALVAITAPIHADAAFYPGETLNPGCAPTDPTCIVLAATSTVQFEAPTFRATSTTATSTLPNLDVTNINISGNVYGVTLSATNSSTTNSTSTNATSTNLFSTLARFGSAIITGTTTTGGLNVTSFLTALLAYIDQLTVRVATLYTATVGSLTATSTASF